MSYKIKKLTFRDMNFYLESLNNSKKQHSTTTETKIKNLDHYIWWMNNQNLEKRVLLKNEKKMIVFWYKKNLGIKKNLFFSGWWPVNKNFEIETIFYITKKLLYLSKNLFHVAVISKKNKFSIKLHKHFKFDFLNKKSNFFNQIIRLINKKNNNQFVIMIRKN